MGDSNLPLLSVPYTPFPTPSNAEAVTTQLGPRSSFDPTYVNALKEVVMKRLRPIMNVDKKPCEWSEQEWYWVYVAFNTSRRNLYRRKGDTAFELRKSKPHVLTEEKKELFQFKHLRMWKTFERYETEWNLAIHEWSLDALNAFDTACNSAQTMSKKKVDGMKAKRPNVAQLIPSILLQHPAAPKSPQIADMDQMDLSVYLDFLISAVPNSSVTSTTSTTIMTPPLPVTTLPLTPDDCPSCTATIDMAFVCPFCKARMARQVHPFCSLHAKDSVLEVRCDQCSEIVMKMFSYH